MIYAAVYQNGHAANSLFAEQDTVHRYNPLSLQRSLRAAFRARGIEVNTADVATPEPPVFELHIEGRPLTSFAGPRFLLALENPFLNPLNVDDAYLAAFEKVFAWDRRLWGRDNVVPTLIPHPGEADSEFVPFADRTARISLINANKHFPQDLATATDLYQERIALIRWYEEHAPDWFDLYGMGWHKPARGRGWQAALGRRWLRLRSQLFGRAPFPSWRGEVDDKLAVYRQCRFAICYENVSGLDNYLTEKMLDALLVGCVPVYWGAGNVQELVPQACFVDRRQFRDTAELHSFLQAMSASEYAQRQAAIRAFWASEAARAFAVDTYVATVVEAVLATPALQSGMQTGQDDTLPEA